MPMAAAAAAVVRVTSVRSAALRAAASRMSSSSYSSTAAAAAVDGATTGATATTTSKHYRSHTSATYESAYFYSPGAYTSRLARLVRDALGMPHPTAEDGAADDGGADDGGGGGSGIGAAAPATRRRRVLVDVGGGTGNFTRMLVGHPGSGADAVVVDPFLESSSSSPSSDARDERVKFVKASAEDFASEAGRDEWWRSGYHQVLLKEVVHHIADGDREGVFRGLREGMSDLPPLGEASSGGGAAGSPPPPSILIVTRPQTDVDYPLWPEARRVWAENQPSASDIEADLASAGFADVGRAIHPYPCEIELDRWLEMVRNRFWSTFSNFADEELEAACERIREERAEEAAADEGGRGRIRFEDRLVFISARR